MTENHPQLSVLLPGIRVDRWPAFYESIANAFKGSWELIIVGPYPPTINYTNVRYYEDWGNPIRCQQIALTYAKGEWLTWASDDGRHEPGSIDAGFEMMYELANFLPHNVAVTSRYLEGELNPDDPGNYAKMQGEEYWHMGHHSMFQGLLIPPDYYLLNVCLVSRAFVTGLGGWDCQFETHAVSWNDFSVRAQRAGLKVILQPGIVVKFDHMPGWTGDHGPIHFAQTEHDEPLFRRIWSEAGSRLRGKVDIDNWQHAPARWERRFGKA